MDLGLVCNHGAKGHEHPFFPPKLASYISGSRMRQGGREWGEEALKFITPHFYTGEQRMDGLGREELSLALDKRGSREQTGP